MSDGGITLVDAALPELGEAFRFEQVQRILLTHFHMDHVQGLFPLRLDKWHCIEKSHPNCGMKS
jgi:phosphoribosyl 1,2-cyclic phosphate phosphodiesterase